MTVRGEPSDGYPDELRRAWDQVAEHDIDCECGPGNSPCLGCQNIRILEAALFPTLEAGAVKLSIEYIRETALPEACGANLPSCPPGAPQCHFCVCLGVVERALAQQGTLKNRANKLRAEATMNAALVNRIRSMVKPGMDAYERIIDFLLKREDKPPEQTALEDELRDMARRAILFVQKFGRVEESDLDEIMRQYREDTKVRLQDSED